MEIKNLKITKRGKLCGGIIIALLLISIVVLVIFEINQSLENNNYVKIKQAFITGDSWKVCPQISGKVAKVNYKQGDAVNRGNIIFELDKTKLKAELEASQMELFVAKSQYNGAVKGLHSDKTADAINFVYETKELLNSTNLTKDSIKESLQAAKESLVNVLAQLKPYRNPVSKVYDRSYALSILKQAYEDKPDQSAEYLIKENSLLQLFTDKTQDEMQILELKSELSKINTSEAAAKLTMNDAKNRLDNIRSSSSSEEISLLGSVVKAAQAQYNLNKLILGYADIKAPHDGIVADVYIKNGDVVDEGFNAVTILDMSKLYVTAYIEQESLLKVKEGQKVELKLKNKNNKVINGKVEAIGKTTVGFLNLLKNEDDFQNIKNGSYVPVKISIEGKTLKLSPYMELEGRVKITK